MTNQDRYNKDKASVVSMIKFILITLIGVAVIYFFSKLAVIMIPFLISFILAKTSHTIAKPLADFINRKKPLPKPKKKKAKKAERSLLSKMIRPEEEDKEPKSLQTKLSIVFYVILLIFVCLVLIWCIFGIISQANNVIIALSSYTEDIDYAKFTQALSLDFLSKENGGFLSPDMLSLFKENLTSIASNAIKTIPSILSKIIAALWSFVGSLPAILFSIICVILSGYYFISDGPSIMKFYLKNVPNKKFRKKSFSLINDLSMTLFRVLGGYISLLVITALEAYIVLRIADVPYTILLALVTGLIDFLPVLGISATMIPVIIYCFIQGNYFGVVIIIIGMAIMTVIRRILEPVILGKSMKLHPLLMLVGMVIGVYVWGAIGFLLGPTVMIIVIQTIKVFEMDKKILAFLSRVLSKFMKAPEKETES